MVRRVLVTRPQPGADRTASRLAQSGFDAIVLPLSETVPLVAETIDAADFDAIAVTSANAIRHATPAALSALRNKPVFAVGLRTAATCREAGLTLVFEADGDAMALARVLCAQTPPASRVLYLCGKVRRPHFEAVLAMHGIVTTALELYDTLMLCPSEDEVHRTLGHDAVTDVLVFSQKAAFAILSLARLPALAPLLAPARYICISERVADAFSGIDVRRRVVAATPDEQAMIALLDEER
ncbi:uroporphyrinogen-III synthase [Mesorhizobium sp. NBSH29]|uniref:uroporphyrinogen-III synthase n=1 Tax=Mesorhizobium sp. NBSH29 TaxID=2654249 RepID=UPI001896852B|nr:uroporphyrinogen-III synthase [Mesorhizobium sp. NBSH29]QPC85971.1 uroporphyrinogen-III synthase [Mesorhizobium sp. NBSH29]